MSDPRIEHIEFLEEEISRRVSENDRSDKTLLSALKFELLLAREDWDGAEKKLCEIKAEGNPESDLEFMALTLAVKRAQDPTSRTRAVEKAKTLLADAKDETVELKYLISEGLLENRDYEAAEKYLLSALEDIENIEEEDESYQFVKTGQLTATLRKLEELNVRAGKTDRAETFAELAKKAKETADSELEEYIEQISAPLKIPPMIRAFQVATFLIVTAGGLYLIDPLSWEKPHKGLVFILMLSYVASQLPVFYFFKKQ